ncbi:MAG: flippase-like domain-containing protein [Anaerolineae bacterium]|nr:flippase-like domain-containing protein [Anaerolineae bacterium]
MTLKLTSQQRMWVSWIARLAFAALILALLFTQVDFAAVPHTLSRLDLRLFIIALASFFLLRYIYAYQLSLGLDLLQMRFSIFELFKIKLIAGFYSLLLPGELAGGGATWYKLSRPERKGIQAGALLIYFRLVDTLVLLGVGLIGMWFDARLASPYFRTIVGMMFGGVMLLWLPFCSATVTSLIAHLSRPLLSRLPLPTWLYAKGCAAWEALIAFQGLANGRTIGLVLGLSLLARSLGVFNVYLLALALDIHQPIFVIGWLTALTAIINMMPVSVAGLGVREASFVLLLNDYGISEARALSLSLIIFGAAVVGGLAGGLFEAGDWLQGGRRIHQAVSGPENGVTGSITTIIQEE